MTFNPDIEVEIEDFYKYNNKNKMNKLEFLSSSRFWAMCIGAISIYLKAKGILGEPEMMLIATITAGFTLVRTADRFGEQQILSAGVSKGTVDAEDVVNVPPKD